MEGRSSWEEAPGEALRYGCVCRADNIGLAHGVDWANVSLKSIQSVWLADCRVDTVLRGFELRNERGSFSVRDDASGKVCGVTMGDRCSRNCEC